MGTVSEKKKVELLENAVLTNDITQVSSLFEHHKNFEFTARALGLACRFCTVDMIQWLYEHGVVFNYDVTPSIVGKYECRVKRTQCVYDFVNYYQYILMNEPVSADGCTIVNDDQRKKNLTYLYEKKDEIGMDSQELLYAAVMQNDTFIVNALKELGTSEFSQKRKDIIAGAVPYNRLGAWERVQRDDVLNVLKQSKLPCTLATLKNLIDALGGMKVVLSKDTVFDLDYIGYTPKQVIDPKFCHEKLFELMVKHTNYVELIKKKEALYTLVDESNAWGVAYAFQNKWINSTADLNALLKYAQSKKKPNAVLVSYILEAKDQKPSVSLENALSLSSKLDSVADMKKIWNYKKTDDGTLTLTSYKGEDLDVMIPSQIGKNTVTAVDSALFDPDAPRITKEQAQIRANIKSVIIPGTIPEIPDHLFKRLTKLTKVIFEEGVKKIGDGCFAGCQKLTDIKLPSTLKAFGARAFCGCKSLSGIDIPKGITELPYGLFSGCGFTSYKLPEHIRSVSNGMFEDCTGLTSIELNNHIDNIPSRFLSGTTIEKIVVPEYCTSIEGYAFSDCKLLAEVVIKNPDAAIAYGAFNGCVKLADKNGFVVMSSVYQDYVLPYKETALCIPESVRQFNYYALERELPCIVYRESGAVSTSLPDFSNFNVGDCVSFGCFPQDGALNKQPLEWIVLDKVDGKLLLSTKNLICEMRDYYDDHTMIQCKTWDKSKIRKWLNNVFYNFTFNPEEQKLIQTTLLENPSNPTYHIDGGAATKDKVFVLSYDEAVQYMPILSDYNIPTKYAEYQCGGNSKGRAWVTRTPGKELGPVCVMGDGFAMSGNAAAVKMIRPAIWVKV